MPLYHAGVISQNLLPVGQNTLTFTGPVFEIIPSATDQAIIREITLTSLGSSSAARGNTVGIGFPGAAGITPRVQWPLVADDPNSPASSIMIASAWNTPPTVPAKFLRRATLSPVPGNITNPSYAVWRFPLGLGLRSGVSLVIWHAALIGAGGGALTSYDIQIEVDG